MADSRRVNNHQNSTGRVSRLPYFLHPSPLLNRMRYDVAWGRIYPLQIRHVSLLVLQNARLSCPALIGVCDVTLSRSWQI